MEQGLRFGLLAGLVGALPCPVHYGWIVSPPVWAFSGASKRCSVWSQLLLYAAEVAPKLQASTTSTGGFFQVRFGKAESVLAGVCVDGEDFCTVVAAPTTCRCVTCVLTTCMSIRFTGEDSRMSIRFTGEDSCEVYPFHRGKRYREPRTCG